ncbi:MAG: HEPN domain-containing protein [Acidithiobacillales bacterium]
MRRKAIENLRAARDLLRAEIPSPNASATRAYYAAYHACWHRLQEEGYETPEQSGRRYWRHDSFPREILRAGIVDEENSETVEFLYSRRVIADYFPDEIAPDEAVQLAATAGDLLRRFGISE